MAAAGQNFNQTVTLAQPPEAVSQALIAACANAHGYTVTTAGAGSIVLTRKYRPTWAIVVAIIGLLFFLIGLLALLVKNTETLTVTLAPDGGGTRVTISGFATHEMISRLNSTLGALPALDDQGEAADTQIPAAAEDTKVCPDCAETVKADARICRFCQHRFDENASTSAA